jgi:shikimate dehydrogenase
MPSPRQLLLGLVGAGIQSSRSPAMHEREAAAHGIRCVYRRLDLDVAPLDGYGLHELLQVAERTGFAGVNVTHPCKQTIIPLLTDVSDDARTVGAVNTVVFRDGRRLGYNTDWSAFRASLQHGLRGRPPGTVLQLGAGGAGSATAYALLQMGAARVDIVDVVPERARALADRLRRIFGGRVSAAAAVDDAIAAADGLVHATPTGMAGHPGLPLAEELIRAELWVADVVYFPLDTALLQTARRRGCRTVDGSGMAVWQAVEAFKLFTGLEADPLRMRTFFDEAAA